MMDRIVNVIAFLLLCWVIADLIASFTLLERWRERAQKALLVAEEANAVADRSIEALRQLREELDGARDLNKKFLMEHTQLLGQHHLLKGHVKECTVRARHLLHENDALARENEELVERIAELQAEIRVLEDACQTEQEVQG